MKTSLAPYIQLAEVLAAGKTAVLISCLDKLSHSPVRKIMLPQPVAPDQLVAQGLDEELCDQVMQAIQTAAPILLDQADGGKILIESHCPEPRLFIFGGGHIAQPLVDFAAKSGFATTVVDDRPSFANPDRFPLASQVLCESFARCFDLLDIKPSDYVVIITRGHRHDLDCLRQVLNLQTAYTGMIGSRRRIKLAWEQLTAEGYANTQLSQVHAPIGLSIGAITPAEIAISIIAQVICVKRLGTPDGSRNHREENREVLTALANPSMGARALVTVIDAKGSVPRKPGAKMIVRSDGSLIGSIGGGCSESEVILVALEVIRTGQYRLHRVDMTGTTAEDAGMVCGGIMEVLIEPFGLVDAQPTQSVDKPAQIRLLLK